MDEEIKNKALHHRFKHLRKIGDTEELERVVEEALAMETLLGDHEQYENHSTSI